MRSDTSGIRLVAAVAGQSMGLHSRALADPKANHKAVESHMDNEW